MHLAAMVLFALFVSVVFAVTTKDELKDRVTYGAKVFGAFLGIALLLGWIMYPFT
ncbi:MAG TPA: hypothetical protein VNM72_07570 [Blastocatellia bacterium]|nr:hypothetical protein [Blastocatellia bacterium]